VVCLFLHALRSPCPRNTLSFFTPRSMRCASPYRARRYVLLGRCAVERTTEAARVRDAGSTCCVPKNSQPWASSRPEIAQPAQNPPRHHQQCCVWSAALDENRRNSLGPSGQQLQIIRDEVNRSDRIISELMDYSRLSDIRIERASINIVIDDALRRVFPNAKQETIKIRKETRRQPASIVRPALPTGGMFRESVSATPSMPCPMAAIWNRTSYRAPRYIVVEVSGHGRGHSQGNAQPRLRSVFTTKPRAAEWAWQSSNT